MADVIQPTDPTGGATGSGKVAGIDRRWLIVGGVAVVGYLAYRWYKSRQANSNPLSQFGPAGTSQVSSQIQQAQTTLDLPGGVAYQGPTWGINPLLASEPVSVSLPQGGTYKGPGADLLQVIGAMTGNQSGSGTGTGTTPPTSGVPVEPNPGYSQGVNPATEEPATGGSGVGGTGWSNTQISELPTSVSTPFGSASYVGYNQWKGMSSQQRSGLVWDDNGTWYTVGQKPPSSTVPGEAPALYQPTGASSAALTSSSGSGTSPTLQGTAIPAQQGQSGVSSQALSNVDTLLSSSGYQGAGAEQKMFAGGHPVQIGQWVYYPNGTKAQVNSNGTVGTPVAA